MMKARLDTSAVSGFIADYAANINKAVEEAKDEVVKLVIDYAKANHKFTSRTGNLQNRAIKSKVVEGGIEFYLDYTVAKYAEFIVTGKRKGSGNGRPVVAKAGADPFLEKAVTENEDKIIAIIRKHIERISNG